MQVPLFFSKTFCNYFSVYIFFLIWTWLFDRQTLLFVYTQRNPALRPPRLYDHTSGEGKRGNEFAEWHVAWLAEWHNYAECKIWKLAQRNKLNWKACARHCRAFFGANLSEQLLYWFTHLDIYLKHTWELARVPEGSLQTKTLKSGKYSEAWPK